jgi:DNA-binding transcriptional LysR family regulator
MDIDLNALAVFVAVAETKSFRAASKRIGVTHSAVSQAIRRLEISLGVSLFQRTTRSVNLTEAGARLLRKVAPTLDELGSAIAETVDQEAKPRGRIRLAVSSIAEQFIDGPLLATFVERYPEIGLDITVTDEEFDIVDRGYDAGVRLGEVLDQDMVAIPVSGDQRQMVVGAPHYLERFGVPDHPRDLQQHRCIGWRPSANVAPYRWEFTEDGRDFAVEVGPQITTNDMWLMLRTAVSGGGLTFGMADTFRPYLARGELVPILDHFCPPFPGFFLYFSSRRDVAPKLRALIDHAKDYRRS